MKVKAAEDSRTPKPRGRISVRGMAAAEVDKEVEGWLAEAYAVGEQRHLQKT